MNVILASQSPRRKELMGLFHIPFTIQVADVDETMNAELSPAQEVCRVSRLKAEGVRREADDIVIAADTIVVCQGQILGKPRDEAHAKQMLRQLSGKSHQVMTGLTVLRGDRTICSTQITDVFFRELTQDEIDAYVASGEPMDKAGAYGIQGQAGLFVEKIHGDYYNVIGLPVCRLGQILKELTEETL